MIKIIPNFETKSTCITLNMRSFRYFCIFFIQKNSLAFVSVYTRLLEFLSEPTWETYSACLKTLYNLDEVFRCLIITDFMLKIIVNNQRK